MTPRTDIVVPVCFAHTNRVTCTSPWYVCESEYHPTEASYMPLVNGEETFRAVHLAIAQAKKTIDIICWGFQPSMYFIRDGKSPNIGELLIQKASEGVRVRVLGWEMPFNSAGAAGEANLPGKGLIRYKDRALQSATDEQYAFDCDWFMRFSVAGRYAAVRDGVGTPRFVSRGFSMDERAKIAYQVNARSLDPELSTLTELTLSGTVTHHQKSVMVDYELPDSAIGFVMGHNMLDEYWDTDLHSSLKRSPESKPAPNQGSRGVEPRQDISSQISGPILEHLHHNFATAWHKETGENLLKLRKAKEVGPTLKCTQGSKRQIAQLLRTQAQTGRRDIEHLYLQAVNNVTQFIYIENQYFRWPPLAEAIKQAVAKQIAKGRDPEVHGNVHLFVITNATDDGMGAGTVNTQRMLESLGRADTIPAITKLRRIEKIRKNAPAPPQVSRQIDAGRQERDQWKVELDRQIKEVEETNVKMEEIPGLKVHVCSLVAPDTREGYSWMPVYIHSKLMIVDDVFTTHGSANINTRSMMVDSELNIAHEWAEVTEALRRRLWNMHTSGIGVEGDPEEAFKAWEEIITNNKKHQMDRQSPIAPLIGFIYDNPTLKDLD